MTKTAILIINWNGLQDTLTCLKTLTQLKGDFSVYLVDNHSNHDELAIIKKEFGHYKWLHLFQAEENLGFVGGNNFLFKKITADYDYFFLLNNDTKVPTDLLQKLDHAAQSNPKAGILGPEVWEYDQSKIQSLGMRINLWTGSTPVLTKIRLEKPYDIDGVSGCAFFITRTCYEKVGMLDEQYFTYYEETDYCVRAQELGFDVMIVPGAKVFHRGGGSLGAVSVFQERMLAKNRMLFVKKNGSRLQYIFTILYMTLFYLWARSLRLVIQGRLRNVIALWNGFSSGLTK